MVTILKDNLIPEIGLSAESTVSSLNFARLIQDAILCNRKGLKKLFHSHTLVYEPKNILSGDFYYYHSNFRTKYLAVCDCTGHGMSGALLSILGHNMLERAFKKYTDVGDVITYLNKCIIHSFDGSTNLKGLGMDMIMISLNPETNLLTYSGARRPLYILSDGKLEVLKTDRNSVGTNLCHVWDVGEVQLKQGDRVFMFSDGVTDQFGEQLGRKLGTKKLKQTILQGNKMSMDKFDFLLRKVLNEHKGQEVSTDDSLLIGFDI